MGLLLDLVPFLAVGLLALRLLSRRSNGAPTVGHRIVAWLLAVGAIYVVLAALFTATWIAVPPYLARVKPAPGSPAEAAGVRAGDYVMNVPHDPQDDTNVTTFQELEEEVVKARLVPLPVPTVPLMIYRDGKGLAIDIRLERDEATGLLPYGDRQSPSPGLALGNGVAMPFRILAALPSGPQAAREVAAREGPRDFEPETVWPSLWSLAVSGALFWPLFLLVAVALGVAGARFRRATVAQGSPSP